MYSRRPKESHLDTVRYEIDILDFCAEKLMQQPQQWTEGDSNVYLEGFLVHYRNLLRFFSGKKHRSRDISMKKPETWASRLLTDGERSAIQDPARDLDTKYYDKISTYIQHCTIDRHENDTRWDVKEMYRELDAIITAFERLFPREPHESTRKTPSGLVGSNVQTVRTQAFG